MHLGTDKQVEKYMPLIKSFQISGAYAQTELGHGSDVQNLETTAYYDKTTEEFIINSPTVTATKWWIGDLGIVATHVILHAILYLDKK
jgi:acyl-CoA oxidase